MKAMNLLSGQKITAISVDKNNGATDFQFDLGATLSVRRFENDSADIWTLNFPNGMVLGIQGNGMFTYQKGSTPADKVVHIPLKRA